MYLRGVFPFWGALKNAVRSTSEIEVLYRSKVSVYIPSLEYEQNLAGL